MFARVLSVVVSVVFLTATTGCATSRPEPESSGATAVMRTGSANPLAAPELNQFGQFVGRWDCAVEPVDGVGDAGVATWVWSYAMDGFAVQDLWLPVDPTHSGLSTGTALRIYDTEKGLWRVAWTSVESADFAFFDARLENADIVMRGQAEGFDLKMVFFEIADNGFAWRYEARGDSAGSEWEVLARMRCSRDMTVHP